MYSAFTSCSQLATLKIYWKLALVSILGIPLAGFGAALLAILMLHSELNKSANYQQFRDIMASIVIPTICSAGIYFALLSLALGILD